MNLYKVKSRIKLWTELGDRENWSRLTIKSPVLQLICLPLPLLHDSVRICVKWEVHHYYLQCYSILSVVHTGFFDLSVVQVLSRDLHVLLSLTWILRHVHEGNGVTCLGFIVPLQLHLDLSRSSDHRVFVRRSAKHDSILQKKREYINIYNYKEVIITIGITRLKFIPTQSRPIYTHFWQLPKSGTEHVFFINLTRK